MKTILVVIAVTGAMAFADTVSISGSDTFINMPANATFAANTNTGNLPYWNNRSQDGISLNIGYFLTNTGGFAANTLSPAPAQYLGNTGNNNLAPGAFSFIRNLTSIQVTILYQNANANVGTFGTIFGIYDANNGNKTPIYSAGTIPSNVGVGTNVSTAGITGAGVYGFYATTCQVPNAGTLAGANCFTFYTNPALNPDVTNIGSSFIFEGPSATAHQHFALFTLTGDASSFYLGYEDSREGSGWAGATGFEKIGDYNDVIFKIGAGVSAVPEPATSALMGLGLLALGLGARRRARR